MNTPYRCRIMTAIGDTAFELVRFVRRNPCETDWKYWMNGREGRCWVETPINDCKCITERYRPKQSETAVYMRMRRARERIEQ